MSNHDIRHVQMGTDTAEVWYCRCGAEFDTEAEAKAHTQAIDTPENKVLNCIASHNHQPQPAEIVYEARGEALPNGIVLPNPVEGAEWKLIQQNLAERSRVTVFICPNCKHKWEVGWDD